MKVSLIAATKLFPNSLPDCTDEWDFQDDFLDSEVTNGDLLIEFAGRACYQSWSKPNARTATNEGYIDHLLEVGHMSVLEHAQATFYIEGVSRSLTHELVRHRHFAYSQLSQRYVGTKHVSFTMPPEAQGDEALESLIEEHNESSRVLYKVIVEYLDRKLIEVENPTERRKRARQTARAVLGNNTSTSLVMTGNYRAWRHFLNMRGSAAADPEIRELAAKICFQLGEFDKNVFGDYLISTRNVLTTSLKPEV